MAQGSTEPSKGADVIQVQHQIRANAAELQDYFADLYTWEQRINKEDQVRKTSAKPSPATSTPMPRTAKASTVSNQSPVVEQARPADAHTYDKGYKKWDKFDIDAALREADNDDKPAIVPASATPVPTGTSIPATTPISPITTLPASSGKSREDIEREEGNEHYKRGDYVAAIKSYTRALGFHSQNVVVLSNRAMAYLKNKEYSKAEEDCTLALKIDGAHVKSLSRRATARNSLGKHRLALLDFEKALALDPKSKQIATQVTTTKELIKTAIKRTPKKTKFSIQVVGEPKAAANDAPVEDKENVARKANNDRAKLAPKIEEVKDEQQPPPPPTPPVAKTPPPAPRQRRSVPETPLPKVPSKAPTSSYEFLRVWKTLAPKGDAERKAKLQQARASYLRLLQPSTLPAVFKDSIESEIFCDIFATIRAAMDVRGADHSFVQEFVVNLPRVPRFSMTAMFLTESEKADCTWVIEQLLVAEACDPETAERINSVKMQYGLQ